MTPRSAKCRRGMSLTELLLLMSSCTIILTTSAVLLHRVMRIQVDSRAFMNSERAGTRLSHQFRQDVHQAAAAELDRSKLKKDVFLQLRFADNQIIEYGYAGGTVSRTLSRGEKITARDEFVFQPTCTFAV